MFYAECSFHSELEIAVEIAFLLGIGSSQDCSYSFCDFSDYMLQIKLFLCWSQ